MLVGTASLYTILVLFINVSTANTSLERSKTLINGWNSKGCQNFQNRGYFSTVEDSNSCGSNHKTCSPSRQYLRYPGLSDPNHRWPCSQKSNFGERKAIVSHEHKFIYLDTPKVGSTSMAALLMQQFNLSENPKACLQPLNRILEKDFDSYFVFSFVRDPVKRLESALGQAQIMGSPNSHTTMLSMLSNGCFVDAHAFSIAKHIAIPHPYKKDQLLEFDFLGSLENFDEDSSFLISLLKKEPTQRKLITKGILKNSDVAEDIIVGHHNRGRRDFHNSLDYTDPNVKQEMCKMVQHDNICFPMVASTWLEC